MTERRVVVTGIGTINPLGNNIEEYFSNLEKGVSGAAPITHFDAEKFKTKFACEVKNYDSNLYFDRKEVRKYDLFTQYALIAATQAVEDSALDLETVDKEQVGVIWSSGIGGIKSFFDECLGWAAGDGTPRFSPFFIPRMISDIAAGFISMKYGFMGPNYCTVSACASSNHGMIAAFDAIRYGKADVMVAGGSEAAVNEPSVGGFNSMQALSTRNDDPQHASRPFDKDRDGFVIGGGFTAAEESVFLTKFDRHVTMLIRKNDFACPASVADKARNHEKITVLFNTVVQEVSGDDGLRRIQYQNTATGEIIDYQSPDGETIGVFVFAGYAPDTALVSGIAERDARGYIITDENQKTSVEGLYAAGDICIKPLRQVITAASDGAVAAAALEKYCGALRGESCI